ncbi:MAG: ribosomal protein L13e [Candidatus Thorarchaeota archaeon]
MSFDIDAKAVVKSPKELTPRKGRGFTKSELVAADLNVKEARDMGLMVDLRRKTHHDENVEILKKYVADMEKFVEALMAEEEAKPDASDSISELASLRAVKKSEAEILVGAGISTIEDLAYCEIGKVSKKTGITEDRLTEMVTAALKKV